MFVFYELGGQGFLARWTSKLPRDANVLGVVEFAEARTVLDYLVDGVIDDHWVAVEPPLRRSA